MSDNETLWTIRQKADDKTFVASPATADILDEVLPLFDGEKIWTCKETEINEQ